MLTSEQVKNAARSFGADIVGIGSIDRWAHAPINNDPKQILPEAKSVICLGFRIHRGTFRSLDEGSYYSGYTTTGFADLNNFVGPLVQRRLASFIEDTGNEAAIVVFASNKIANPTAPAPRDENGHLKAEPDVFFNHRIGAVLCGVGQIGLSRLVITPEFGPGQRFFFLLTDAELTPDPIMEQNLCDGCGECLRKCPGRALSRRSDDVNIPQTVDIRRFTIDPGKCGLVHGGAISPFAPEQVRSYAMNIINGDENTTADGQPRPRQSQIMEFLRGKIPYTANAMELYHSPAGLCGGKGCMRACIAHLEKRGKLTHKFNRPLYQQGQSK
jgi:ferredoxin